MKKNNYIIFLLFFCITGCVFQSKQEENQKNILERDTAYMIEPFLRDGITYICKDEMMRAHLVDYNYSPPQKYKLNQITAKKQGNKVVVGTDCIITHTILSSEYWEIENIKDPYSSPKTKLAILRTDKGEVRIAEVDAMFEDFCVLDIKYDNYEASTEYPSSYYKLPQEMFAQ